MSSNSKQKIFIIGGGTGGTIVANILARKAAKESVITMLTSSDKIYYEPDNLFRLFDKKTMQSQYKFIRKAVNKRVNIEFEKVTKIDPEKKSILVESGKTYVYDYLIIATGARYDYDAVPGYRESAYNFHDPKATLKLREALENFEGGNIVVSVADIPFKCPVSPLEFVFMSRNYFKKRKILDKVKIHYTSPLPRAFSIEKVSNKVQKRYDKMGVEVHTFFNTESIDPQKKIVTSLEGEEIPYDLLVMVPPHRGQQFIIDSNLSDGPEGWIPVDRETLQHSKYPHIYAIGDATNLPVSKAGAAAHHEAKIVGANLANIVKGKNPKKKYDGHVQCFLMTSLHTSIFLDFNYKHPPRVYGMFSNQGWFVAKKIFKPFFFRIVLTGRV